MMILGKPVAHDIRLRIKEKVAEIKGRKPGLAFILIGENPASETYVRMKTKACEEVGFFSKNITLPESVSENELLTQLHALNEDPEIDGILVQQPFPKQINAYRIIEATNPEKDVDGFHPINLGKLLMGEESGFMPCTPFGIATLLDAYHIPIEGKHVVILGRSNIVGKPLAAILMQKKHNRNATVTVAHSASLHLKELCKSADILIAAIGKAHFIKREMVKKGAIVIDVGINRIKDSEKGTKIVGDVDFENVSPICSQITPVPGGVGPMTIAMLLSNTFISFERKIRK